MKPLPKPSTISVYLEGIRLYRDDIEQLLGLLTDAGMEVKIKDDAFEYTTLDELASGAGRSPRTVKLEAKVDNEYKSISLGFSGKRWHIFSIDPSLLGLARECEARMRERQTAVVHLPIFWIAMAGNIIVSTASFLGKDMPATAIPFIMFGVVLLATAGCLGIYFNLYPRIILRFRHEGGFLSRNRDQLILLVAGAAIGALFGALSQWVVGQFVGKS